MKGWEPLHFSPPNPASAMASAHFDSDGRKSHFAYRTPQLSIECRAFANRLYDGLVLTFEDGSMHLSFKRRDRAAVRDWRHFQAIKNEVAGIDREAIEIFPPETDLTDAANEYHLWVLPPGTESPLGLAGYAVGDAMTTIDHALYRSSGGRRGTGGRQRGWESGLPTGIPIAEQIREAAKILLESGWRPATETEET